MLYIFSLLLPAVFKNLQELTSQHLMTSSVYLVKVYDHSSISIHSIKFGKFCIHSFDTHVKLWNIPVFYSVNNSDSQRYHFDLSYIKSCDSLFGKLSDGQALWDSYFLTSVLSGLPSFDPEHLRTILWLNKLFTVLQVMCYACVIR